MNVGMINKIKRQKSKKKHVFRSIGQHLIFKSYVNDKKNKTLINNDSEIEFLNKFYAHRCKFDIFKLEKKINLILGNGKKSERMTKKVLVNVDFGEHVEEVFCYLTDLKSYTLILGNDWLRTHNPLIDWKKGSMNFNFSDCLESGCLKKGMSCTKYAIGCKDKDTANFMSQRIDGIEIQSIDALNFLKQIKRKGWKRFMWTSKKEKKKYYSTKTTSKIFSTFMKKKPQYTKNEILIKLPKTYHEMMEVFMKSEADVLAPHKKKDHEINLTSKAIFPYERNYRSMSEKELKIVKKYIDEHLKKGFIRFSSSAAFSPVLLIRKPKGRFRFCVDYKGLNALTVKNKYSISLLNETLKKFFEVKIFSKLNIIHAFNKIRIKKDHEWLTVFNTRYE